MRKMEKIRLGKGKEVRETSKVVQLQESRSWDDSDESPKLEPQKRRQIWDNTGTTLLNFGLFHSAIATNQWVDRKRRKEEGARTNSSVVTHKHTNRDREKVEFFLLLKTNKEKILWMLLSHPFFSPSFMEFFCLIFIILF